MDLAVEKQLVATPQLRKRLRQMRWFAQAFRDNDKLVSRHLHFVTRIDDHRLHQTFFDWVRAIEPVEHDPSLTKADRIVFLGGLALRQLLKNRPVTILNLDKLEPAESDPTSRIARSWPEGFIYTNFCICSIIAVHEQEFGEMRPLDKVAYDLRTWWSYRENVSEDPDLSIPFLDLFFGETPNWLRPTVPAKTGPQLDFQL